MLRLDCLSIHCSLYASALMTSGDTLFFDHQPKASMSTKKMPPGPTSLAELVDAPLLSFETIHNSLIIISNRMRHYCSRQVDYHRQRRPDRSFSLLKLQLEALRHSNQCKDPPRVACHSSPVPAASTAPHSLASADVVALLQLASLNEIVIGEEISNGKHK